MIRRIPVSSAMLSFETEWIVQKALKTEVRANLEDAVEFIHERDVPMDRNIISSHTRFNLKTNDDGTLKRKRRIVVHGHLYEEKDDLCAYCAAREMLSVLILLSMEACMGSNFGC